MINLTAPQQRNLDHLRTYGPVVVSDRGSSVVGFNKVALASLADKGVISAVTVEVTATILRGPNKGVCTYPETTYSVFAETTPIRTTAVDDWVTADLSDLAPTALVEPKQLDGLTWGALQEGDVVVNGPVERVVSRIFQASRRDYLVIQYKGGLEGGGHRDGGCLMVLRAQS